MAILGLLKIKVNWNKVYNIIAETKYDIFLKSFKYDIFQSETSWLWEDKIENLFLSLEINK